MIKLLKIYYSNEKKILLKRHQLSVDFEEVPLVTKSSKLRARVAKTTRGSRMKEDTARSLHSNHFRSRKDHHCGISILIACQNVHVFQRGTPLQR